MRYLASAFAAIAAALIVVAAAPAAVASHRSRGSSVTRSSRTPATAGTTSRSYSLTLDWQPAEPADGHRRDHGDGDAEPVQLRPRPARLHDLAAARERRAGVVRARRRAGARDHAADRAPLGTAFTVTIDYAGTPAVVTDPDESLEGWVPTDDGAFVVGEPQGSPAWYPVNDNPRDKATYDFRVTVPAGTDRDGERRARLEHDDRRQDDLGLAGDRSDGPVPRDRDARPVRPDDLADVGRNPVVRRGRPAARRRGRCWAS